MGAEFGGRDMQCVAPQLIPFGPGYDDLSYQSCTVPGSKTAAFMGEAYLQKQYGLSSAHVWRDFGFICKFLPHPFFR
jgi:hypothetical protein